MPERLDIGVKIITGDTSGTAKEIARQIGLWGESSTDDEIITGAEFEALTDDEAKARLTHLKIMRAHALWTRSASYTCSKSRAKSWPSPEMGPTMPSPQ